MYRIAIIEDAEDNRDLLYYLLRDEFTVARFSSGEEALRCFADEAPDLILLDIWLPGMDGIEVLKKVRQHQHLQRTPVLALTANAMSGDREKYLSEGFTAYIPKPITDVDEFVGTVRRLLISSID
jgi:CheY-like chemotaxis protein